MQLWNKFHRDIHFEVFVMRYDDQLQTFIQTKPTAKLWYMSST